MHEPLIVGKVVVMLIGFFIAYQAYQGYQRNNSLAMFYLAFGFTLISIGTAIEGILFEFVNVDIFLAGAIQTVITAAGMLTILYSLYGNHTRRLPIEPLESDRE